MEKKHVIVLVLMLVALLFCIGIVVFYFVDQNNNANVSKIENFQTPFQSDDIIPNHIIELQNAFDSSFPELGGTSIDYSSSDEYNLSVSFGGYDVGDLSDDADLVFLVVSKYVSSILSVIKDDLSQYAIRSINFTLLADGKAVGSVEYDGNNGEYDILLNGATYEY